MGGLPLNTASIILQSLIWEVNYNIFEVGLIIRFKKIKKSIDVLEIKVHKHQHRKYKRAISSVGRASRLHREGLFFLYD